MDSSYFAFFRRKIDTNYKIGNKINNNSNNNNKNSSKNNNNLNFQTQNFYCV